MDARTFGNYLSRMRKAQGLTQAELAEQLHVTDKAVSRWERGIGLPDINTLEPLADALGLTLADLMHCRAPEEADAAPTIPLEDFFTMLCRQHTVDWHSVRTALLGLSIALALWGVLACPGTIAVHWYGLGRCTGMVLAMALFGQTAGCLLSSFSRCAQALNFYRWKSGTALNRQAIIAAGVRPIFLSFTPCLSAHALPDG